MAAVVSVAWELSLNDFFLMRVSALGFHHPLPHLPLSPCCCDKTWLCPSAQAPHSWAHTPHGPGAHAAQALCDRGDPSCLMLPVQQARAPEFSVTCYAFARAPITSLTARTSIQI